MKISIKDLKFVIFEACLEGFKNKVLFETFGSFDGGSSFSNGETGSDSIGEKQNKNFSASDVSLKIEKLVNQSNKLRDHAEKEKDPRKSGKYRALSDEFYELAQELGTKYHETRDPNIIWDVFKQYGLDPLKV